MFQVVTHLSLAFVNSSIFCVGSKSSCYWLF